MKKILFSLVAILVISYSNILVFAQTTKPLKEIDNLTQQMVTISLSLVSLLNIVAFIAYISIIIMFIIKRSKGDQAGMDQFRGMLVWGVVAMFFLVAVWGLVYFLSRSFGISMGGCVPRPSPIPGQPAVVDPNCGVSADNSKPSDNSSRPTPKPSPAPTPTPQPKIDSTPSEKDSKGCYCPMDSVILDKVKNSSGGIETINSCFTSSGEIKPVCPSQPQRNPTVDETYNTSDSDRKAVGYKDQYGCYCDNGNARTALNGDILDCGPTSKVNYTTKPVCKK